MRPPLMRDVGRTQRSAHHSGGDRMSSYRRGVGALWVGHSAEEKPEANHT
jgi:hypothetical protein